METALRQSLIMSRGDFLVFWKTPVSGVLMTVFAFIVCARLVRGVAVLYRQRAAKAADQPSNNVPAIIGGLVLLALLLPSWGAQAQEYPTRSITIIAPYPPGGRTDLCGRTLAQFLKTELGQPVVVINKPGASGVLGAKEVASAAPDGYTLGLFSTGFLTAQYTVPTPTDVKGYELIALINMDPAVIAVPEVRGWHTLPDYVRYAKENPGKVRVGIDAGSSAQIFAAAFAEKAGTEVTNVPFRGGGERTVALAGGHIGYPRAAQDHARGKEGARSRRRRRAPHSRILRHTDHEGGWRRPLDFVLARGVRARRHACRRGRAHQCGHCQSCRQS
jgi:hypothetical protein